MEQQDKDSKDIASKLSKVTPSKKGNAFSNNSYLYIIGLVCFFVLISMSFSQKTSSEKAEVEKKNTSDYTLSENLELIEKMKRENSKQVLSSQTSYEEEFKKRRAEPPKLRHDTKHIVALSKEVRFRMNAPSSFDIGSPLEEPIQSINENEQTDAGDVFKGKDANSHFMNDQGDITTVSAKKLPHPALTIPAGEMIPATLETAINSDLPGMLRAITTRDIYSLEGGNPLIPRGSTLIGQFNSGVVEGQNRIFAVWNRVQMNGGIIVSLNSPSTDQIGRAGQGADFVDRHFFERFGTSALLSVLGAYTSLSGVSNQDQYNSASQYRSAMATSLQQASSQTLEQTMNIKPTLQVNQGTKINVFVAHDLDFYGVGMRKEPSYKTIRKPSPWK